MSCLHGLAEPPGGAPPHRALSAAGEAGAAAAQLGVGMNRGGPKSAAPATGEPRQQLVTGDGGEGGQGSGSGSGGLARGTGGVPGDSARWERTRGRCGNRGCLRGPLCPSLAGYGGHWGQQQVGGHTHASPAPAAPRSAHHRPGPRAGWGAREQGSATSPRRGRRSANFLRVAARSRARGRCRAAAPGRPRAGGEGRRGCRGGGERRPPGHTRAPPGPAASEVSALTLPLLWLKRTGFPPPSPRLPVSSLCSQTQRLLKGAARYFPCVTLHSPDASLASSAH